MEIKNLMCGDSTVPFEKMLELMRSGKIERGTFSFRLDSPARPPRLLWVAEEIVVTDDIGLRGLGIKKEED